MSPPRDESAAASYTDAPLHRYPRWAMRFWHGMDFFTWMKLLVQNRFAFAPIRLSMVATVTLASMLNTFASVFVGGDQLQLSLRMKQKQAKQLASAVT